MLLHTFYIYYTIHAESCFFPKIQIRFVCSIFILLSRESDGGAIFWTNPHPLGSCPFSSYLFVFLLLNLLLVRSHQAEIIIVKRFIQGGNNVSDGWWELNLDHAIVIIRSP